MGWFARAQKKTQPHVSDRATESDVRHAYRLLLKRDPDPAGLTHYLRRVREGVSLDEVIREFVRSDEHHALRERERVEEEQVVDLGGYQLLVPTRDPDFGRNISTFKEYEEPVRRAIREHLGSGDTFIDIGANMGVMTFLGASIVGAFGRVVAVEPNPENVQLLFRNIVLNGATTVEVLPLAASDRRAVFSLTGRSNTHLIPPRGARAGGHLVQSVPLDDLLGELPRVDLVKLDVEGHEPPALAGMMRILTRHRPTVVTEFNPRCLDVQRQDPGEYLRRVFALYPAVRVISHFGDDERFEHADDVMHFWERRDGEVTARGLLPRGLLHFDLVAVRD
jgi:FkbM family methyltransferase